MQLVQHLVRREKRKKKKKQLKWSKVKLKTSMKCQHRQCATSMKVIGRRNEGKKPYIIIVKQPFFCYKYNLYLMTTVYVPVNIVVADVTNTDGFVDVALHRQELNKQHGRAGALNKHTSIWACFTFIHPFFCSFNGCFTIIANFLH